MSSPNMARVKGFIVRSSTQVVASVDRQADARDPTRGFRARRETARHSQCLRRRPVLPQRHAGQVIVRAPHRCSKSPWAISVSTSPGQTLLTRIPATPSSSAAGPHEHIDSRLADAIGVHEAMRTNPGNGRDRRTRPRPPRDRCAQCRVLECVHAARSGSCRAPARQRSVHPSPPMARCRRRQRWRGRL